MKVLVGLLATVIVWTAYPAHADVRTNPAAHAGEIDGGTDTDHYLGRTTKWRPRVFVVGDSVTNSVYLHRRLKGSGWEVSSVPGREVQTLPYYLHDRLADSHRLTTVVVALGTNASAGWTRRDYREAIDLLPDETRVVFVTPYRDPALWPESGDYKTRAINSTRYATWMIELASQRKHTCIAPWRHYARARPGVLHDGVHPSNWGTYAWARIVRRAVTKCASSAPTRHGRRR